MGSTLLTLPFLRYKNDYVEFKAISNFIYRHALCNEDKFCEMSFRRMNDGMKTEKVFCLLSNCTRSEKSFAQYSMYQNFRSKSL